MIRWFLFSQQSLRPVSGSFLCCSSSVTCANTFQEGSSLSSKGLGSGGFGGRCAQCPAISGWGAVKPLSTSTRVEVSKGEARVLCANRDITKYPAAAIRG